jgi:signal recognition particle subunit SRP19
MRRISKDHYRVIYPQYIDSRISRQEGRRVPKSTAVSHPKETELRSAAEGLGMRFEIQPGKSYPRAKGYGAFRMLVFTAEPKSKIIEKLAKRIGQDRGKIQRAE